MEIYHLPAPKELTPDQHRYWEEQLEVAERTREYCLRMLGRLGVEKGLE